MNIEYHITKTHISLEGQRFSTYGIAAIDKSSAKTQTKIVDVSLDESFVRHVADLLNSAEVELCHFAEVVDDSLIDKDCKYSLLLRFFARHSAVYSIFH